MQDAIGCAHLHHFVLLIAAMRGVCRILQGGLEGLRTWGFPFPHVLTSSFPHFLMPVELIPKARSAQGIAKPLAVSY